MGIVARGVDPCNLMAGLGLWVGAKHWLVFITHEPNLQISRGPEGASSARKKEETGRAVWSLRAVSHFTRAMLADDAPPCILAAGPETQPGAPGQVKFGLYAKSEVVVGEVVVRTQGTTRVADGFELRLQEAE